MNVLGSAAVSHLLGGRAASGGATGAALAFALHWLAVCLVSALLWWVVVSLFARRPRPSAADRGRLFLAFALLALAGSCLTVETRGFAPLAPLPAMLVPVLFPLFYYLFSDVRFAPRWSRWLVVFYAVGEIGALLPPKPSNPRVAHVLGATPGLLGALGIVGDCGSVTAVALALLPQVYTRWRTLRAEERPLSARRRTVANPLLGLLVVGGAALTLMVAGLFTAPPASALAPAYLALRTAFFLLATLAPVAIAFALARGARYDRAALASRMLTAVPLVLALAGIYAAYGLTLQVFFPDFSSLASSAAIPFVLLIALILAAIFRPLRARIQSLVGRWLFHRAYVAERVLGAFPGTLGPNPRLEGLGTQLVAAIQKALDAEVVVLWLCALPERLAYRGGGLVASRGQETAPAPSAAQPADQPARASMRLRRQAIATRSGDAPALPAAELQLDDWLSSVLRASPSGLPLDRLPAGSTARLLLAGRGELAVPLVAEGEVVGVVTLAVRPGAPPYTVDERALLAALLGKIAPTLRALQWEHEQEQRMRERERVEQELRTARRIQESLLPKAVPALDGWRLTTLYQPAREVGGDFYDFLELPDGRLGIVLGDVTDKGMPAALVMATTRSMLRAVAMQPSVSPGQALAHVNELLCADLPASMFVTCFYGILDPATGHFAFANAGQDLPFLRYRDGAVGELHATGMPLGLLPGMRYEEQEVTLPADACLLFYSDGIVEAHDPAREMFGFPRLRALFATLDADVAPPIPSLVRAVRDFTGADWQQEDDITLVALQRRTA